MLNLGSLTVSASNAWFKDALRLPEFSVPGCIKAIIHFSISSVKLDLLNKHQEGSRLNTREPGQWGGQQRTHHNCYFYTETLNACCQSVGLGHSIQTAVNAAERFCRDQDGKFFCLTYKLLPLWSFPFSPDTCLATYVGITIPLAFLSAFWRSIFVALTALGLKCISVNFIVCYWVIERQRLPIFSWVETARYYPYRGLLKMVKIRDLLVSLSAGGNQMRLSYFLRL